MGNMGADLFHDLSLLVMIKDYEKRDGKGTIYKSDNKLDSSY